MTVWAYAKMPDQPKILVKWIFVSLKMSRKCIEQNLASITWKIIYFCEFYNHFELIWHFTNLSSNFTSITSLYLHWDNAPTVPELVQKSRGSAEHILRDTGKCVAVGQEWV